MLRAMIDRPRNMSRLLLCLALGTTLAACARTNLLLDGAAPHQARVTDAQGRGLTRMPVQVVVDHLASSDAQAAARQTASGVTGEDGVFSFGLGSMEAGSCSFWADPGGGWRLLGVLDFEGSDGPCDLGEVLQFELPPRDHELRLRVEDPQGAPVPSARVRLLAGEGGAPVEHHTGRWTDADGTLLWSGLEYGSWWIEVAAPGHAVVRTCPYQFRPDDATEGVYTVQLRPEHEIAVEVIDAEGLPVVDISVGVSYANAGLPTFTRYAWRTDAEGRVRVVVPADGPSVLEAGDGWEPVSVELSPELASVVVRLSQD